MVEGAALEMLCRRKSTVGSNPTLSAIFFVKKWRLKILSSPAILNRILRQKLQNLAVK